MGFMKTLCQSSKELKDILDRLTALESGETFVTKDKVYTKDEVYPKDKVYTKDEVYKKDEVYTKNEVIPKSKIIVLEGVYENTIEATSSTTIQLITQIYPNDYPELDASKWDKYIILSVNLQKHKTVETSWRQQTEAEKNLNLILKDNYGESIKLGIHVIENPSGSYDIKKRWRLVLMEVD